MRHSTVPVPHPIAEYSTEYSTAQTDQCDSLRCPFCCCLSQESLRASMHHLESLCAVAARVRVPLLVDAEQSHRQPAYVQSTD